MTTLRDLVDDAHSEWGDAEDNISRLVPFGYQLLDKSLTGIPIDTGAIFQIQGYSGSRKTSAVLNFLINQCLSGRLPQGYHIAYDTLESGMTIERIRDIIWAMVATKYLIYWHWNETQERDIVRMLSMGLPDKPVATLMLDVADKNGHRETILKPEFFRYGRRTQRQMEAIQMAGNVIRNWPIMVFGSSGHPDPEIRRQRTTPTWFLGPSIKRWQTLYEENNVREIVIDHVTEYVFDDNPTDFEIQRRVVPAVAGWQKATLGVAWMIIQVGVTSARESRREGVDMTATGGNIGERESTVTWTVMYDQDDPYFVRIKRPNKSRMGMHPDLAIKVEPNSGAFIGQATLWGNRL